MRKMIPFLPSLSLWIYKVFDRALYPVLYFVTEIVKFK